jgi:hypothetical protein
MDPELSTHVGHITLACSPATAYALISDITASERSPIYIGGEWDEPEAGPRTGAWFTGHNREGDRRWSTRCQVEVANPDSEFTFVMCGLVGRSNSEKVARWSYRLTPVSGGTEVTESWECLPAYLELVHLGAHLPTAKQMAADGIPVTLANLKREAERVAEGEPGFPSSQ